jgi:hypothetical protein
MPHIGKQIGDDVVLNCPRDFFQVAAWLKSHGYENNAEVDGNSYKVVLSNLQRDIIVPKDIVELIKRDFASQLTEDRREDDPLITYLETDENYNLINDASGKITKVIAVLEGSRSAAFTRMAKDYYDLGETIDRLIKIKETMNVELGNIIADLFAAEDSIYTRIVRTCTYILRSNKDSKPKISWDKVLTDLKKILPKPLSDKIQDFESKNSTKYIDAASVLAKLETILPPELKQKLDQIKEEHTTYTYNNEGIVNSINEELTPQLKQKLEEIIKMYSEVKKAGFHVDTRANYDAEFEKYKNKVKAGKVPGKKKEDMGESINETLIPEILQNIKNLFKRFKTYISNWGKSYDKQLLNIIKGN